MFTKQNKSLQTGYVYKTKQYKTESLQTRYVYKTKIYRQVTFTKVYKHVMVTKQNTKQKFYKHVMFIKQNVFIQVMFTKETNVYKTKVLQHVMFTKQNTKHILLSQRVNFEPFHNLSVFHSDDFVSFT